MHITAIINHVFKVFTVLSTPRLISNRKGKFRGVIHSISEVLIFVIDHQREVKMAGYWPGRVFVCLSTMLQSRTMIRQKIIRANAQSS